MSQIAEAFVRLRPETSQFRSESTQQVGRALRQTERDVGRFAKGTLAGSGALHSFGRAAVFASSSVLGGYGLAYALKTVTKAATEHVALEAQLQNAVQRSGLSYRDNAAAIQKVVQAQEQLGFAEDVSTRAFTLALRATGSITGANRLLATSANVARGANKDLYSSTLVLVRAYDGATTGLKRLGIQVKAGSKGFDAINQVQQKYAGAAAKYADTAAGAQARLDVAIHRTEVTIGTALLPTITRLATGISNWLDKSKNQERIQRDVNTAVKDGTAVVKGITGVIDTLSPSVRTLVGLFGGLENTVKLAAATFGAWKLAGLASSFGRVGAQAKVANVETKALAGNLGRLKAFGTIGITIAVAYEVSKYGQQFSKYLGGTGLGKALGAGDSQFTPQEITGAVAAGKIDQDTLDKLNRIGLLAPGAYAAGMAALRRQGNLFGGGLGPAFSPNPPSVRGFRPEDAGTVISSGPGSSRAQRIQAILAAAAGTKSTADDLKALAAQRVFLAVQIAAETKRLEHAVNQKQYDKFFANLQTLKDQDNSAWSQIQSIEDQNAAAAKTAADKAAAASAKAARNRIAAAKKIVDDRIKAAHTAAEIALGGATGGGVSGLGVNVGALRAAYAKRQAAVAKAKDIAQQIKEGALTLARQAADVAAARAQGNETLLNKATVLERKADQRLIAYYKQRIRETKGLAQQDYKGKLNAAQIDRAGLRKTKPSGGGFTLAQLFAEAGAEFAQYGSNIGAGPLSPQDARGQYAGTVKTHQTTVVQNFYGERSAGQGIQDAYRVSRNAK